MNGRTMTDEEAKEFVEKVGSPELLDEIESMMIASPTIFYPRYLKAVQVTLIGLGYDKDWVETTFKGFLEDKYLSN